MGHPLRKVRTCGDEADNQKSVRWEVIEVAGMKVNTLGGEKFDRQILV